MTALPRPLKVLLLAAGMCTAGHLMAKLAERFLSSEGSLYFFSGLLCLLAAVAMVYALPALRGRQ